MCPVHWTPYKKNKRVAATTKSGKPSLLRSSCQAAGQLRRIDEPVAPESGGRLSHRTRVATHIIERAEVRLSGSKPDNICAMRSFFSDRPHFPEKTSSPRSWL